MTALMTVAEAEKAEEEAKSDSAAAAATSCTQPPLELRSFSLNKQRSGLSESGDMMDSIRMQLTAERSVSHQHSPICPSNPMCPNPKV